MPAPGTSTACAGVCGTSRRGKRAPRLGARRAAPVRRRPGEGKRPASSLPKINCRRFASAPPGVAWNGDLQWPREGCHGVPRGGEEPARDPSAVMSPRFGASERLGPGPQVGPGGGVAGIQTPRGCANAVPSVAGTVTRGQLRPGEQMRTKNFSPLLLSSKIPSSNQMTPRTTTCSRSRRLRGPTRMGVPFPHL